MQPRPAHWAMLGFLSVTWGFSFYLIAVGLRSFPPLTLVNLRLAIGALVLFFIMRWQGHRLPPPGGWWLRFALLSVMGNLIPFYLISWSETRIDSAQTGLLMALMPISTLVLGHYFVQGDTITPRRLSGVLLGLGGVAVLIGGDALRGIGGVEVLAQGAVLAATLAYAVNAVYTKSLPRIETVVVSTGTLATGTALLLPFSLYLERPWLIDPGMSPVLATGTLGALSTGLATWVYFRVVSDCGPGFLSIINYIIPGIAFAAGVLLLGESAAPSQFLGLVFICLGIALIQNRPLRYREGADRTR